MASSNPLNKLQIQKRERDCFIPKHEKIISKFRTKVHEKSIPFLRKKNFLSLTLGENLGGKKQLVSSNDDLGNIYSVTKRLEIFPSPARMSLKSSPWPGRKSLVSDIPAGDGKIASLNFTL